MRNTVDFWRRMTVAAGLGLLILITMADRGMAGESKTLAEWRFGEAEVATAWGANGDIMDKKVADGVMSCRTTGNDPILELHGAFEVSASARQVIEVELKADHSGEAELFWSNTKEGPYGGFSQEKSTRFSVVGDNQWHCYRVLPFWQSEKKIIRMRFDLFGGTTFGIKAIRIVELPMVTASDTARFDLSIDSKAWQPTGTLKTDRSNGGVKITGGERDDFLLGPPIHVDAEEANFVAIRMTATHGKQGELVFSTSTQPGRHSLHFPIIADGQEHWYNLDMLTASGWRGKVVAIGVRPSDDPLNVTTIQSLGLYGEPQGPAHLTVISQSLDTASPRVGIATPFVVVLANKGGGRISGIKAELQVPANVHIESYPNTTAQPNGLSFTDEVTFTWILKASEPVKEPARLLLTADQVESITNEVPLEFAAQSGLPKADYVPEPKSVRGKYDVGVYYFPGWQAQSQWQPVQRFPERKPMLGWYREGEPEIADWQIKWAVEHGITFFAYDWYWSKGSRSLEHGIHKALFHSRYQDRIKFCLLWANHNAPKTHSVEDSVSVAQYWLTNYFQKPGYYKIDNKPVVIIFSPYNYRSDLGVDGVNRAFEAMREECRKAGFPGLYLIACVANPHDVDGVNYDALTAYNWPGLGLAGAEKQAPYASLVPAYVEHWNQFLKEEQKPLLLPLSGGWDSRPWHGDSALVRHGRTPALFKQHLQDAHRFLDAHVANHKVLPAILIEAWNEWGEGSYIEPHKEFGFQYLDAIRDVFVDNAGAHSDLAPVDVGMGPYDVKPMPPAKTKWTFEQDTEEWRNTMDMDGVAVAQGVLKAATVGNDPAFFSPPIQARATDFSSVFVKMKLTRIHGTEPVTDHAQLFWATKRWPESEASSMTFPVAVDGQWHEYDLPVQSNSRWSGTLTRLRLDPVTQGGIQIELAAIELKKVSSTAQLKIIAPWQLQVSTLVQGKLVSGLVDVKPAVLCNVVNEFYDHLPVYDSNTTAGWARGVAFKGVFAQECSTPGLLDTSSVLIRSGTNEDAVVYELGKDYAFDHFWGTMGRLAQGRIGETQAVYASYRHSQLRLDSIVLTTNRHIEYRVGKPCASGPTAPQVQEGELRLANVWFPGEVKQLMDENLFPILETEYPESPKSSPAMAAQRIPRALAKLEKGEPIRILAWGDSVTDGVYLPTGQAGRWQEQFVARLQKRFPKAKIELITVAWGGRNTGSFLAEPPGSPHNYKEKVLDAKPDLIVSEFVNDAGMNPEEVEQRYGKLLQDFQAIQAEWIILTPHYVRPDWMGLATMKNCDDDPRPYVKGLREFSARHTVALADASLRYGRLWRQGIPYNSLMLNSINHPCEFGMKQFADALMELFP